MKVSYSKILQRPNYLIVLIFFRKQKGARMRRKSAVQEVSCHKELQGNLWGNWKLGNLGGAGRTGAARADAAVPLPLRPITMPVLAAGALGAGACLPVWPTTKLSSSGTAGRTAASAPTTILLGAGGAGSPEKNVAPSCLDIGFGFRWWLVEVRLDTVYPWVDCKLPSV